MKNTRTVLHTLKNIYEKSCTGMYENVLVYFLTYALRLRLCPC